MSKRDLWIYMSTQGPNETTPWKLSRHYRDSNEKNLLWVKRRKVHVSHSRLVLWKPKVSFCCLRHRNGWKTLRFCRGWYFEYLKYYKHFRHRWLSYRLGWLQTWTISYIISNVNLQTQKMVTKWLPTFSTNYLS